MTLFVIVGSLILERLLGQWQHLRKLPWFKQYREWLFQLLPESWQDGFTGAVSLLLPPLLVMLLVQSLGGWVWQFLLSVVMLTYCLGPEAFNERIDDYLNACEADNRLEAKTIAESLVGESVSDNVHQQTQAVATAILYEANVRIFGVIFWFILLGPAGALLYRCSNYLARDARLINQPRLLQGAETIFALLDWIPARLLSLTFFLSGSFEDALKAWRQVYQAQQDLFDSNRSVVILTGCGAMRHEVNEAFDEEDHGDEYDLYWVRTAKSLILRSLIAYLAAIAVFTMAGWFV